MTNEPVTLSGEGLTIADLVRVARHGAPVRITDDPAVRNRIDQSRRIIMAAVDAGASIYGVTTAFGGMSNVRVPSDAAAALQKNIAWPHKTGTGPLLPEADVRAAMLLRASSLTRGVSGVRPEIIQRLIDAINGGLTPHVHEMGSIGASGDLVPLAYILGAVVGLDPAFRVTLDGQELGATDALDRLGLPPIELTAKEGLSVMNGTSVMTGIAALNIHDLRTLTALTLGAHALIFQGMGASNGAFHPFISRHKPHPGQVRAADLMRDLLDGSALVRDELSGSPRDNGDDLAQDRYALRCLPQYLGPVLDSLSTAASRITVEMSAATDNPLVDPETGDYRYCGNFLGQYVGVAMDALRRDIAMMAKHLDVQIGFLVAPEFNNGLPASLVGNPDRPVNIGLKGLQITANSMMPLLLFYGNGLVDRYPTHAEQFNQNINSQGFGAATLARKSVEIFREYVAAALIFGVQAADLRTHQRHGHYDARKTMSPATVPLYEAVRDAVGVPPDPQRPYIRNDDEQALDLHIQRIAESIRSEGAVAGAVEAVGARLEM